MGTDCHLLVVGPGGAAAVDRGVERIRDLEQRWSRFLPDSEISQLNGAGERAIALSPETMILIERAILAWRLTDGRFNPLMQRQLTELGYDRTFEELAAQPTAGCEPEDPKHERPAMGCDEIIVDHRAGTVQLPEGVGFDGGGIGKGLASDLVATELVSVGAWGALVNLGGDLRVIGTPPSGSAWTVTIAEPALGSGTLATVQLTDGGLATSTTRRRRWKRRANESQNHHLLDPATGLPAAEGPQLTSVIAGEAWWAEAAATAIGANAEAPLPDNCSALLIEADNTIERFAGFGDFEPDHTADAATHPAPAGLSGQTSGSAHLEPTGPSEHITETAHPA